MHMQGTPETMQNNPSYKEGIIVNLKSFFSERLETLSSMGMDPESICFDPGIGFGKTVEHNIELLRHLNEIQDEQKRPLLLGVSRKSIIDKLLDIEVAEKRDYATAAITALAYSAGVRIHRVHNVMANIQSLRMAEVCC